MRELTRNNRQSLLSDFADAFERARNFRIAREDQALENYKLYMRKEATAEAARAERNEPPMSGSKLRSPLVYWGVETLLPRLGVQPPTVTATAATPEALPYAAAKQYRLQYYVRMGNWHQRMIRSIRQMLILGDSPVKVPFLSHRQRPEMLYLSWWDFWISPEAEDYEHAEILWHRTLYTKDQWAELKEMKDGEGRLLYSNLDEVERVSRSAIDPVFADRQEASGDDGDTGDEQLFCLIEGWHQDGSLVTLGNEDGRTLVAARAAPYKANGRRYRPFALFSFTPDIVSPYATSLAELIGDHQTEVETLRNAQMDQITGNLQSPIAHMDNIPGSLVDEAFSRPNGRLPIDSGRFNDVRQAVMRMPPGQATGDYERARDDIRTEIQLVTGINDVVTGLASPQGMQPETATGAQIMATEANKRVQILGIGLELQMTRVARMIDAHDRQFGGELVIPIPANMTVPDRTPGLTVNGPVIKVGPHVNTREKQYLVEVDAGSLTRIDQMEEARKLQQFVGVASHPQLAPHFDWAAMARMAADMVGYGEKVILTPMEQAQQMQEQQAAMAAVAGPPLQLGPGPSNQPGAAQGPQGALAPPAAPGPPAPPNVTGPMER